MPDDINNGSRHEFHRDQETSTCDGGERAQPPLSAMTPGDSRFVRRVHDIRHLVSGEWAWDVLVTLHRGPMQYTSLLESIRAQDSDTGWPGRKHRWLQDSPLNRTLRRLEQGELITRHREINFPYHATYELSPAARELLAVMTPLATWAETHTDLVHRARQRRHAEDGTNR